MPPEEPENTRYINVELKNLRDDVRDLRTEVSGYMVRSEDRYTKLAIELAIIKTKVVLYGSIAGLVVATFVQKFFH